MKDQFGSIFTGIFETSKRGKWESLAQEIEQAKSMLKQLKTNKDVDDQTLKRMAKEVGHERLPSLYATMKKYERQDKANKERRREMKKMKEENENLTKEMKELNTFLDGLNCTPELEVVEDKICLYHRKKRKTIFQLS